MLFTRIRPVLLVAACALLAATGAAQDKTAPPRADANPRDVAKKELEAQLVGRTPEQAVAVLEQLAREWAAHKGAYEVAAHRFAAQTAEVTKARQQAADAKAVPAVPPVTRAADIPAALKAAQEAADAGAVRAKLLGAVKAALDAAAKTGDEFAAVAGAADDHLFKVQTAVQLAKGVPADKLPPAFAAPALADAAKKLKATNTEVKSGTDKARADAATAEKELADAKAAAEAATARLEALKASQAELTAAFAYEAQLKGLAAEPLTGEFTKLRKALAEKTNAIAGDRTDYEKAAAPVAEARARLDAVRDPLPVADGVAGSTLDAAGKRLAAAQQYLAARVRTFDERAEKTAALVATLDEQEKKALAYSTTLNSVRETSRQLSAAAAEIGERVGRGDLDPAKAPDGLAEAVGPTGARAKLDADATAVQELLVKLRAERDKLRKPDTEAEGAKALTAALLANVNERIDLHTDLKKLAADSATTRATRSEAEQKRLDQKATERMAKEAPQWDMALAFDRSTPSTNIAALLTAYYAELVELEEKDDNLKRQKEALEKLVKLTEKEAGDAAKLRSLVEKEGAFEIPPAQLDPGAGIPFVAPRVLTPTGQLDRWLAARLTPDGLKAEADTYHAEVARLAASGGANTRRTQALTADIASARQSLLEARARGLITLAVKVALVLLAALILPWLLTRALRRSMRVSGEAPSPVLKPIRGALRVVIWLAALAVVLNILGFDVTAFVIAVAVGVLAFALAARPLIADMLGSVAVSAERRFKVGDVIRLGGGEPARVMGVTWRAVSLKNTNGIVSSVPNRAVAEATVENLTRGTDTYDTLTVTISTDKDAGKVITVIRSAMAQCKNLTPDQGVTVVSYIQKGAVKLVQYRFWWFLKDYELRNKTRDEVFARVSVGLAHEDMAGIELALA